MHQSNGHFKRISRLAKSHEFEQVFNHPTFKSIDGGLVLLVKENEMGAARLGLVISRKHVKTAVKRNLIKRLIRESFRSNKQRLPSLDIVVIGRKGVGDKANEELRKSLENHWKKIEQCRRC